MIKYVPISQHSYELIAQVNRVVVDPVLQEWSQQEKSEIKRADVVSWLQQKVDYDKKARFLVESLHAALLHDLHHSFLNIGDSHDKEEKKSASWFKKAQFISLAIAGTLLAICEGFDGIASILGSFPAVPIGVVFVAGIFFSLVSVSVFYVFELVDISQRVGVNLGKSHQLLDVFLEQVELIERLRIAVDDCYASEKTDTNERKELQQLIVMLSFRYNALDKARQSYVSALNDPILKGVKFVTTVVTAIFCFCGGFFAGQTLALAVAGLFLSSVSAALAPVVVASALVGLAALSLYWFIERPVLADFVGYWFGLDKDNIDAFANDNVVEHQKQALCSLDCKMSQFEKLHNKIALLTSFNNTSRTFVQHTEEEGLLQKPKTTIACPSSFFNHRRSHSLGDISHATHDQMFVLQVA